MPTGGAPHVAVVGAGILGSSIAVNLARRGCRVTLLESAPRAAEGATAKSWAWLNANRKTPAHYKELNKAGMEEWRSLISEPNHPDNLAEFPGTLYLGDDRRADPAYPSEELDGKDAMNLEQEIAPAFSQLGGRQYHQEGYGYPARAAAKFVEDAKQLCAEVHFSAEVSDFSRNGKVVTEVASTSGRHAADIVVLAAGLGIPRLASQLGTQVPLADKPGTLTVLTQPMPRILHRIVVTDDAFIMQRRNGEVMISFFKAAVNHSPDPQGHDPPTDTLDHNTAQKVGEQTRMAQAGDKKAEAGVTEVTEAMAQQEMARAAEICPALKHAKLGSFSLAKFPYPADAHPILGWLPGLDNVYVAVTHSGATLGPLIGRLVAEEVLGSKQELLQPYRPDRDFSNTAHLY